MQTVVFYVSGHGFGHASRAIELINALRAKRPTLRVILRTTAPRWLFDRTIKPGGMRDGGQDDGLAVVYHHVETDTGIVQIDSLHLDAAATVRRARDFMRTFDERVESEVRLLNHERASLVVADIPPLGIAAGAAAGVPVVALGNFTWDWIYAAYPGTEEIVRAIGDVYARANLALRLPMHGGFTSCPRVIDLPFIARRSERDPRETRAAMNFPLNERPVLVSFGGYGLTSLDLDALGRLEGYVVMVSDTGPLGERTQGVSPSPLLRCSRGNLMFVNEPAMYDAGFRYEDIVGAVDVVVSKPGYGIIAECLANDTALLYTSRGHFIEHDVLVTEMPRFLRAAYIGHADLFSGRWASRLDALLAQAPPPERPSVDGADVAAEHLLTLM